jgi:hypothetical protein
MQQSPGWAVFAWTTPRSFSARCRRWVPPGWCGVRWGWCQWCTSQCRQLLLPALHILQRRHTYFSRRHSSQPCRPGTSRAHARPNSQSRQARPQSGQARSRRTARCRLTSFPSCHRPPTRSQSPSGVLLQSWPSVASSTRRTGPRCPRVRAQLPDQFLSLRPRPESLYAPAWLHSEEHGANVSSSG